MEVKKWMVEYSHEDGRSGTVEAVTKIEKNDSQYGNGKSGALIIDGNMNWYDLRYNKAKDLHMEMIKAYFGNGIVKVTEVRGKG